jgi:hypothetical protein
VPQTFMSSAMTSVQCQSPIEEKNHRPKEEKNELPIEEKNHRPKEEKNGTTNEEKNQGPKDMDQGEGVIDLQHTPLLAFTSPGTRR